MQYYTGLAKKEDKILRESNPNEYIVVEYNAILVVALGDEEAANTLLKNSSWDSWCAILSPDAETAKSRYYDAHDQWKAKQNGKSDWENIVLLPEADRD